jgi:hypothetical protein
MGLKLGNELGMVVHVCDPSTQEAEAGGQRPAWSIQYYLVSRQTNKTPENKNSH